MNYLAVDSANEYLAVVAKVGEKVLTRYVPDCAMRHSTALMREVDELLKEGGFSLRDFDCFAAVVGAGSFTGIRIGIATVKGFALATGKKTLPITSFDVLAYNGVESKTLCLVDALHGNCYACGYDEKGILLPPVYLSEEEVIALQKEGYALRAFKELPFEKIGQEEVTILSPVTGLKKALEAKAKEENFAELSALYVRKSSAELNREKGV